MIHLILKNRLKQRTNKNFVKWRVANRFLKDTEFHHLLGSFVGGKKQNDYLLAELPEKAHKEIHYKHPLDEDEFISEFVKSLEFVFDYIEHFEEVTKKAYSDGVTDGYNRYHELLHLQYVFLVQ